MPVLHEPVHLSDLLKYEAPNLYSRDEVIVAAGQTLALGAVVGRVTATHEIVVLDPTANDGREAVAGVLIEAVVTARNERKRSVIVSRHALVFGGALVLPTTLTSEQTTAALAQLTALGIVVRQPPQVTAHVESVL
ncbi:MAG: head decoration protein [Xanthomonadales bacterium]|nr:head decoration protein [Xanthomonadales bacterium]